MVYRPSVDPKLCFVVMPFGSPFDGYYKHIIEPAAASAGLRAQRADEIYGPGCVVRDIWNAIWRARVVVADVSGRNANVNYEIGLCHAIGVPTILVTRNKDDVPFDFRQLRYIFYNTEEALWAETLKTDLQSSLASVLDSGDLASELGWPYEAGPVQKTKKKIVATEQTIAVPNLFNSGLVMPLGSADTHLLQVLLTDFNLERMRGGAHLCVHFDNESPTIWRKEAQSLVRSSIGDFEIKAVSYQNAIDEILYGLTHESAKPFAFEDLAFPFRYANGGTLPIIKDGDRAYYCLFYRDAYPVGWNIANGGSDSREELFDPLQIVERELREELIIFDRLLKRRYVFEQNGITVPDRPESLLALALWENMLRSRPGQSPISREKVQTVPLRISWLEGTDSITIQADGFEDQRWSGFFLNINSRDCGIEIDRIAEINVPPETCLLDGERRDGKLLNRPIGLFDVARFEAEYDIDRHHQFIPDVVLYSGERRTTSLEQITEESYRRHAALRLAPKEGIQEWLDTHETKFDLCPVTRSIIRRHQKAKTKSAAPV